MGENRGYSDILFMELFDGDKPLPNYDRFNWSEKDLYVLNPIQSFPEEPHQLNNEVSFLWLLLPIFTGIAIVIFVCFLLLCI